MFGEQHLKLSEHEVNDLVIVVLKGDVVSDDGEALIQDGQEHIHQYEEHGEHEQKEEHRTYDGGNLSHRFEVELPCRYRYRCYTGVTLGSISS